MTIAGADPGFQVRGGAPAALSPKIGKNMIFWRKIVIFHTKHPQKFFISSDITSKVSGSPS
jgi:hypothetical protein